MQVERISLYYRDGGSDKVYHAQLEPAGTDDSWMVNFQYGRRGQSLQTGTKTASPVPYATAKKTYDKLVKEKMSKGYTPGEDGTPFAGTDKAGEVSGLVPQLLNMITEKQVHELIANDAWLLEEKKDGVHLMAKVTESGDVIGSNRKGLVVALPGPVEASLRNIAIGPSDVMRSMVLDGELIGDVYYVFDMLEVDGDDLREVGAEKRLKRLSAEFINHEGPYVQVLIGYLTTNSKQKAFDGFREGRREGVVFKKKDSKYVPGRPNSGGNMLKFKFKGSATCMVLTQNGTKRSVGVAVLQDNGQLQFIGNVTIPANYKIPAPGAFVEIEYLYCYPNGGSLFQPVYKGPREDKSKADLYSSLKFKGTDEDET